MKLRATARFGILFLALAQNVEAYSIQRSNKLTIIQFGPEDFEASVTPEDEGRYGGFAFQSPPLDLAESHDSELIIHWTFTGSWKSEFKDACEFADYYLGVLELNYNDRFGNPQFDLKAINPSHFGVNCENDKCSNMQGNTLGKPRTIVHGPLVLRAGAKNIQVGLSDVAADTRFELKNLEIRFRPLK